jgi:FkbM family methyltransferase
MLRKAFRILGLYYSLGGILCCAMYLYSKLSGRRPLFKKTLVGIQHPVYLRIGTTDASVFRQVLLEQQYDLPVPMTPAVIIDAGANIGLSALYFANKYPNAIIIAIEPEDSNYELLKKNTAAYPKIRALKLAIWKENTQLCLFDPMAGHHGFQIVKQVPTGGRIKKYVKAVSLDTLMAEMNLGSVDILKIDIEGAEKYVFEGASAWINKIAVVMVELHDHIVEGCSSTFFDATRQFDGQFSKGETIMRFHKSSGKAMTNGDRY